MYNYDINNNGCIIFIYCTQMHMGNLIQMKTFNILLNIFVIG